MEAVANAIAPTEVSTAASECTSPGTSPAVLAFYVRGSETGRPRAEDFGDIHGKLYFNDSYKSVFDGVVAETAVKPYTENGDKDKTLFGWVRLDGTYFYPTSGGQPNDTGMLGDFRVVNVIEHEHNVWHLCILQVEGDCTELKFRQTFMTGATVHGEIDWNRRFDHMQQHSGQHLLSGILEKYEVSTTSVHIGDSCTLDCTSTVKDLGFWRSFEDIFHKFVFENRPVRVSYKKPEEGDSEERKKVQDTHGEPIRIVTIEGLDVNPCCGTHVRATGEVGALIIHSVTPHRGGVRLSYSLGGRATRCLQLYQKNLADTSSHIRCSFDELPQRVEQLVGANKVADKQIKQLSEQLGASRVAELRGTTTKILKNKDGENVKAIVLEVEEITMVEQHMGTVVGRIEHEAVIFICVQTTTPYRVIVACSQPSKFNAHFTVKKSTEGGKGGGRPNYAMGAPVKPITVAEVEGNLTAA